MGNIIVYNRPFAIKKPSGMKTEGFKLYYTTSFKFSNSVFMFTIGIFCNIDYEKNYPGSIKLSFKDGLMSSLTFR